MRIAIDARELIGRPTGVGRYLTEILRAWEDLPGARMHEFALCAPEPVRLQSPLNVSMATGPGHGTLWEQITLPRLLAGAHAGVLFAPGYTGPLGASVPMVVTVHDVSFSAHPEWFSAREGLRRRWLTRLSARKAARVITVSDFSKQEIVRYLGVPQSKVEVIYSGITLMPAPVEPQPAGPGAGHSANSDANSDGHDASVLFVGSLFNRRHIPELIQGFAAVAARHPSARLDLVGDNRTQPHIDVERLIAASAARDRIRARAYVGEDELAALYRRARAFVFLSDYEGFAMTPLEALGAGVPVGPAGDRCRPRDLRSRCHVCGSAGARTHCRGSRARAVRRDGA